MINYYREFVVHCQLAYKHVRTLNHLLLLSPKLFPCLWSQRKRRRREAVSVDSPSLSYCGCVDLLNLKPKTSVARNVLYNCILCSFSLARGMVKLKTGFNDIASLTPFIEEWRFAIYTNDIIRRGKLHYLSFRRRSNCNAPPRWLQFSLVLNGGIILSTLYISLFFLYFWSIFNFIEFNGLIWFFLVAPNLVFILNTG